MAERNGEWDCFYEAKRKEMEEFQTMASRFEVHLDFAIEIIGSKIIREDDGLAMSSLNVQLSSVERKSSSFYAVFCN
ncbi:hypothetical protein GUJ93_ZPchr0012g21579 [Zizania palustris]|uniref:Uncharacterized protein n=1 Tax=Zizania palustris TaxID=103762 RepID=A0A8J5WI86_ZIZPA|nr:hypothetical protein GUJ93_ZPchr0012g21579 [Zizania palustris]